MAASAHQPRRLVLDTNVVVAGLLWNGPPRRLLEAAIAGDGRTLQQRGAARNDADDDHVIAAAMAARAELIVTGGRKHLLPIGSHQGIAIVTAAVVVERLKAIRKA